LSKVPRTRRARLAIAATAAAVAAHGRQAVAPGRYRVTVEGRSATFVVG
jgi:hypothetical protein